MPTMIQRFECTTCYEVYDEQPKAEACSVSHGVGTGEDGAGPAVLVLDLYECDGEGCQKIFDSQYYAEACEAEHETAAADGKPDGVIRGKGVGEWLSNFFTGTRS
jgi:hypothetical protein